MSVRGVSKLVSTIQVGGFGEVEATCELSECGRYRYSLTRRWADGGPMAVFVLLNPSTATHIEQDPTVRRGMGFARAWGMHGMTFLNLYAFRATKPAEMFKQADPVGPENDETLRCWAMAAAATEAPFVCAWGADAGAERAGHVCSMLRKEGVPLSVLRLTKAGAPWHPLYLPAGLKPVFWGLP